MKHGLAIIRKIDIKKGLYVHQDIPSVMKVGMQVRYLEKSHVIKECAYMH